MVLRVIVTFDLSTSTPTAQKVPDDPLWDLNPPHPLPIIVRATDGNSRNKEKVKNKEKIKLSTVVQPDDIETFFARYAEVCKTGMQSLKKRDRSKRKKDKKKVKKTGAAAEEKKG
jgi:signal recognition particle subunit SRP14